MVSMQERLAEMTMFHSRAITYRANGEYDKAIAHLAQAKAIGDSITADITLLTSAFSLLIDAVSKLKSTTDELNSMES